MGSYLATLHKPGVALWGTADFVRVRKFEHQGVQRIDFSPCERFVSEERAGAWARYANRLALLCHSATSAEGQSFQLLRLAP